VESSSESSIHPVNETRISSKANEIADIEFLSI